MTPFGRRLRELRQERGINQQQLAEILHVSPAYLSALEHGRRSPPTFQFIQKVIGAFNIIWDDAEELQRLAALSNPRVIIDTSGLTPAATELANMLAENIGELDEKTLENMKNHLVKKL
jgi:transcriptional regulator with XRE-family HTH domain